MSETTGANTPAKTDGAVDELDENGESPILAPPSNYADPNDEEVEDESPSEEEAAPEEKAAAVVSKKEPEPEEQESQATDAQITKALEAGYTDEQIVKFVEKGVLADVLETIKVPAKESPKESPPVETKGQTDWETVKLPEEADLEAFDDDTKKVLAPLLKFAKATQDAIIKNKEAQENSRYSAFIKEFHAGILALEPDQRARFGQTETVRRGTQDFVERSKLYQEFLPIYEAERRKAESEGGDIDESSVIKLAVKKTALLREKLTSKQRQAPIAKPTETGRATESTRSRQVKNVQTILDRMNKK